VESEQVAQYNFYLRAQTNKTETETESEHMFHFPSQSHYPAELLFGGAGGGVQVQDYGFYGSTSERV
jgi:hypothetical protein